MSQYKTGSKSLTAIRALRDAHANKDQPVLQQCPGYDIKLHPLRELQLGDRTVLSYPHSLQVHFGPEWCNRYGPPLKKTSWPASARGFGYDSILGKHKHQYGQKPSNLTSYSTRRKMKIIYLKRRVASFADSLKSLHYSIPERKRN